MLYPQNIVKFETNETLYLGFKYPQPASKIVNYLRNESNYVLLEDYETQVISNFYQLITNYNTQEVVFKLQIKKEKEKQLLWGLGGVGVGVIIAVIIKLIGRP